MELAGKYLPDQRQVVAYPKEITPGKYVDQYTVNKSVIDRYKQGDHFVWGGPQVGLFWASDIQTIDTLKPKPIEHAYEIVNKANKALLTS